MAAAAQLTPRGVPAVSSHVNGAETLQAVL